MSISRIDGTSATVRSLDQQAIQRATQTRLNNLATTGNGTIRSLALGAPAVQTPANSPQRVSDPVVDQRVRETVDFAAATHLSDPSYIISETLNDPSLTPTQKDEYIARLVEISRLDNHITLEGQHVTTETTSKLRTAFEDTGDAWTGSNTNELRDQVRDSITRGADSGRLSATDLHGLFNTQNGGSTDGVRYLLSGISNGDTLNSVANMLLGDARRAGFSDPFSAGGTLLVAAADVANMAGAHGRTAAANAVVQEIHNHTKTLSAEDAKEFIQGLVYASDGEAYGLPQSGRGAYEALATLLTSSNLRTDSGREATDALFAQLVRADMQRWEGKDAALNRLGEYFNANLPRMLENDWRLDGPNSGEPTTRVVQDFMRHVMLDPGYAGRDATATAISNEMHRLAGIIGNGNSSQEARTTAASSFGTLMGSLQEAGRQYIADAKGSTEDKVETVRIFSDLITDNLVKRGGPVGEAIAGEFIDSAWEGLANHSESVAGDEVKERIGGLTDLAQIFRNAMQSLDAGLINAFDDRLDQYYDGPDG